MDVVVYTTTTNDNNNNNNNNDNNDDNNNDNKNQLWLAVVEEGGRLQPLSAWSAEPVFGTTYWECLVDPDDRTPHGLQATTSNIVQVVPEQYVSYGSRQVGGGKGPGNPHGEESELLYYIAQDFFLQNNNAAGAVEQKGSPNNNSPQPPPPNQNDNNNNNNNNNGIRGRGIQIVIKPHLEITW
ncbi:hypothetical protein ACA910_007460 [Epithemia clementina (nom. ined.)]